MMKISRIVIKGFQQFQDLDLDLTYPEGHPKAGQALDKICFIGRNGTGKSTLLNILYKALKTNFEMGPTQGYLLLTFQREEEESLSVCLVSEGVDSSRCFALVLWEDETKDLSEQVAFATNERAASPPYFSNLAENRPGFFKSLHLQDHTRDLLIYSPSEASTNHYLKTSDVPETNLSNALGLFNHFPIHHLVSNETSQGFWNLLIYQLKKRESDFQKYLKLDENRQKTVEQVEQAFDRDNPMILKELGALWNRILEHAGLEFDIENASIPIQLNENLKAYIRSIHSQVRVGYNQLSTGIRNFIFRLGHIYLLYFQRDIERGFLLIDEPENSLYPDFLYNLMQEYLQIAHGTQIFVATHHPIIAAQFEPSERLILDFDETGGVFAQRGHAPIGDDPNDVLVQDFQVANLYGKEGQERWERFLALQQSIPKEPDPAKKQALLGEYLRLGTTYNFPMNANMVSQP